MQNVREWAHQHPPQSQGHYFFSPSPTAITDVLNRLSTTPRPGSSSTTKAVGRTRKSWVRSSVSWLVERHSKSEAASPTSNARTHPRLVRLSSTNSKSTQRVWFRGTVTQCSRILDTNSLLCKVPYLCRGGD